MSDRLTDLLAARATEGLTEEETVELNHTLPRHPGMHPDDFDLAAAAAALAFNLAETEVEPMPEHLKRRILEKAQSRLSANPAPSVARAKKASLFAARNLGWYAAAAMLVLALWAPWRGQTVTPAIEPPVVSLSLTEQRENLIASFPDTVEVSWATPESPEYAHVEGDVVWSNERQTGFMRLRGLPINRPDSAQYQLWIVDPTRDEHPIDGGVFDIVAGAEEVIVPIDAKLAVTNPAVFAITLEQPGGVVVSDGPLLVIAAVDAA